MKLHTPCHIEIAVDNVERAQEFYKTVFGWAFEKSPGPMPYWGISYDGSASGKMINMQVGGGMIPRPPGHPGFLNYIMVEDVDATMRSIEKAGGKTLGNKGAVPTMGYYAMCQDTEGNSFGLWQTDPNAK